MSEIQQFNFPTVIRYGMGSANELANFAKEKGFKRPLFVTDKDLVSMSFTQKYIESLSNEALLIDVYSEIAGNPTKSQVELGARRYREHYSDCIIAFGGGAAIDVAKCIAVLSAHPEDLFAYEDVEGARPIHTNLLPFIFAIPTTAGTGSEVGRSAVISDDLTKVKKIIFSPGLLPGRVYLDPYFCLNLPASLTATTGFDALTHLVEAYLSKPFHPLCDGIALEGIKLIGKNLSSATKFSKKNEGASDTHIKARAEMLLASSMGAIAFQKGLGVNHSCAHALSTVCDMHHGLANAIMLPYCLAFNYTVIPEKFGIIARAAGLEEGKNFIDWVKELKKELGIPEFLSDAGVKEEHLDKLVEIAYKDVCHSLNPRVVRESDFRRIFTDALKLT